ncbi:site-2 protease family protein [Fusobacterium sp.]|uniref:site-2 protease family protein n=1 Tax=Fusobacterium sp. TaxID=68766 RepID=UPI00396CC197
MKNFIDELIYHNRNMKPVTKIILIIIGIAMAVSIFHSRAFGLNLFIYIAIVIFSISFHEFAHGAVAYLIGDNTAKSRGRLSFNPLRHIDPIGLLFPVIMAIMNSPIIIGWAKPVPVDYSKLKYGRMGEFLVAISGVTANMILVIISLILMVAADKTGLYNSTFLYIIARTYRLNLLLIILNLLPIPPLDGSKILAAIGPQPLREIIFYLERYGVFIIIALAWTGLLNNFLNTALRYVSYFIYNLVVHFI